MSLEQYRIITRAERCKRCSYLPRCLKNCATCKNKTYCLKKEE